VGPMTTRPAMAIMANLAGPRPKSEGRAVDGRRWSEMIGVEVEKLHGVRDEFRDGS
jgi:hypothetical protein